MLNWWKLVPVLLVIAISFILAQHDIPYFLMACPKSDPRFNDCLRRSINHLAKEFRLGIPELGVEEVEPLFIDEITIDLGGGPDGYRASFKDIEAYGVSNLTVTAVRSALDSNQFQMSILVPKIEVRARYTSSGTLIMIKASGGGDYWGQYEGVKAKVYFKAAKHNYHGRNYFSIEELKMDFSVRDIKMGVKNLHNKNTVLEAAINLFINSNAQDLLREMKPDLRRKLSFLMRNFLDNFSLESLSMNGSLTKLILVLFFII